MEKLSIVVVFPLATSVYLFKGESRDPMVKSLNQTDVAVHFRSNDNVQTTLAQASSTILSVDMISDTIQPYLLTFGELKWTVLLSSQKTYRLTNDNNAIEIDVWE